MKTIPRAKTRDGWREIRLEEICSDISYGYTTSATDKPIGPKFLRITDIVPDRINWGNVPYCKINKENEAKYKLEIGDIVIARTGATTGHNQIIKTNINAIFASYLIRYKIDKSIAYPFYIGYVLKSFSWKNFVGSAISGSAQPNINAKQFADFEFLLPSLSEQKAIAEVLSSLDDKIDLLHRQNKTLEDMAQAVFRKWFVEEADENWEERKLIDVASFTKGRKSTKSEERKFENSMPQILIETFDTGKTLYSEKEGMVIANKKDILMVMDGASSGRTEIGFEGIVGSTIGLYKPSDDFKHPFFIFCFLKFQEKYIKENTTGSAIPHADKNLILNLFLRFPSIERIHDFEAIAESLFIKKQSNSSQIHTLKLQRDALLPKLVSGAIRIRNSGTV